MNRNQPFIDKGNKFVLAIAGGGSRAVGEFLEHGGMSDVVLAAHVFQARGATDAYLGRSPDRYASGETARALAVRAYWEAVGLSGGGPVFGLGAASSLGKPGGERDGRPHAVHVAIQLPHFTQSFYYLLRAKRTRFCEEFLTAALVRRAAYCGVGIWPPHVELEREDGAGGDVALAPEGCRELVHSPVPQRIGPTAAKYVLSSSCNPVHGGHVGMMKWVEKHKGYPVDVELCVRNADKPPLDYVEIRDRIAGVENRLGYEPCYGDLQLTNAGLFSEKADVFPSDTTFVVGSDTILRVNDPKFLNHDTELLEARIIFMKSRGVRFLVFPRHGVPFYPGQLRESLRVLCEFVAEGYDPLDISSTQIRKGEFDAGSIPTGG